ncbi:hypothetical protein [Iningainema tapete]|uniref:Uncharacterized protein n=1 Tax=Iningainema tapete BLCC-T55 TaxID=2748662 RepID=A0A8J6XL19_9CYAN|nr:hypothetical protein [Iningainema tapete]MBD2770668.1 hypothetical protein [Iningainema tapete BLCC-T55]
MNKNERGKRGNPDYASIQGYVPKQTAQLFKIICTALDISQSEVLEQLVAEWVRANAKAIPSYEPEPPSETIDKVVARNIEKLKAAKLGIRNLDAIASGKTLPSAAQFAKIATALEWSEEEQKALWHKTFGSKKEKSNGFA